MLATAVQSGRFRARNVPHSAPWTLQAKRLIGPTEGDKSVAGRTKRTVVRDCGSTSFLASQLLAFTSTPRFQPEPAGTWARRPVPAREQGWLHLSMLTVNGGRSRGRRGAHAMSDSRLRGKWCPVCKTHKPPEEFHRDPSNSDMMHSCCRICKRERKRANRQMLKDARQLLDLQSNGPGGVTNAPVLRSRLQLRLQSAEQDAAANGLAPYSSLQHSGNGGSGAPVDYSQQLAALPPALGSQQAWGSHQQALDSLHLSSSAQAPPLHGREWGHSLLADGVGARGRRRSQGLTHADSETRARLIESFRQAAQQPPFQQLAGGFPVRQVQIKEELSLAPPRLNGAAAHHHPGTGLSAAAELRQYHQQQVEHGGGGQNGATPAANGLRQGAAQVSPHLMQLALQQMLSQLRPEQVAFWNSSCTCG